MPVSPSAVSASGPSALNDVSEQNSVSLQVAFDFKETGEAVLHARAGEIAVALKLRLKSSFPLHLCEYLRLGAQRGLAQRSRGLGVGAHR